MALQALGTQSQQSFQHLAPLAAATPPTVLLRLLTWNHEQLRACNTAPHLQTQAMTSINNSLPASHFLSQTKTPWPFSLSLDISPSGTLHEIHFLKKILD